MQLLNNMLYIALGFLPARSRVLSDKKNNAKSQNVFKHCDTPSLKCYLRKEKLLWGLEKICILIGQLRAILLCDWSKKLSSL